MSSTVSKKTVLLQSFAVVLLLVFSAALVLPAYAQGIVPKQCQLESLKQSVSNCSLCHLGILVMNLTNFLMEAIAFPAAALLFVIGGLALLTSGPSETRRTQGKKILTSTLTGLIIILLAWLMVDSVIKVLTGTNKLSQLGPWNNITTENCPLSGGGAASGVNTYSQPSQPTGPGTGGGTLPGGSSQPTQPINPNLRPVVIQPGVPVREQEVRNILQEIGIRVNKDPCPPGKSYGEVPGGCTNTAGIPDSTLDRLRAIRQNCRCGSSQCSVTLTGGSEPGHQSHGPGQPIVDLAHNECLAKYLVNAKSAIDVQKICTNDVDKQYRLSCNTNEEFRHLHVQFANLPCRSDVCKK